MNKFFKKTLLYLFLMFFVVAIIFTLNYYYGQKISNDLKAEIIEIAEINNYRIHSLELDSNLLLQRITIEELNLTKADQFDLFIDQGEINLNWQQLLHYIRTQELELAKNLSSHIEKINYSNLNNNYQINIKKAELQYQGGIPEEKLQTIINSDQLEYLLEYDNCFNFTASQIKYDFPYYRRYGLDDEEWDKLSTFNDFVMKITYDKDSRALNVEEFNLTNKLLKIIFNFDSTIDYKNEEQQFVFKELKGEYDFYLQAEGLEFNDTDFYKMLKFKQFNFNADLDISNRNNEINVKKLDFNLDLKKLELELTKILAKKLNENSFGILAKNKNFGILINKFNYQQEYNYPNGTTSSKLDSSLLKANFNADYNLSQKVPYLNNAVFKYKPQSTKIEQLNSFLQLVLGEKIAQDEAGYYQLKFWGKLNNLKFE